MSHYVRYYDQQIGGGGVRNVFAGATYQRGRGIGAWLGGLFRKILPYVASGAKAVGKEAVRAGLNVLDDVSNNGVNFHEAIKTRAKESGKNLKNKASAKLRDVMEGAGYKRRAQYLRRQSKKTRVAGRISTSIRSSRRRTSKPRKKRGIVKRKRGSNTNTTRKRKKALREITDIFGPK